jgi:hypothetical protein
MGGSGHAVAPSSRILKKQSKSSSKSERDLDRKVSSDWFESDPSSHGAARVEVVSKMDVLSICMSRLGSSNLSRLLLRVDVEAFGFLEWIRWLLKPPKVLAT